MQPTPLPLLNYPTSEQDFLVKNYDEKARRANRDPRGIFRTPTDVSAAPAAGLVGPLDASSFSLLTVEHAGAPASSTLGNAPSPTQHEVLQNFFKSLLNPKDHAASPGTSVASLGTAATASGKPPATGRGRRVGVLGVVHVGVGFRRQIVMQAVGRKMGRTLDGFLFVSLLMSVRVES
jgi:dynein light intermediate chain 1